MAKRRISKEQAECIALKYLNGTIKSKVEFAFENGLQDKDLRMLRKVLKEDLPELYKKYISKNRTKVNFASKAEELDKIIDGIMYGIEGRKFDLLDYYLITNCNFSTMNEVFELTDHDKEEKLALRKFFAENCKAIPDMYGYQDKNNPYIFNKKILMGEKLIICGYEITEEDKLEAIDFIRDNNLPNYKKLYSIKIRRIAKEKISDQKTYCKKK